MKTLLQEVKEWAGIVAKAVLALGVFYILVLFMSALSAVTQ